MEEEKKSDIYVVIFSEDDFCCNANQLVTSIGERRHMYMICANNPKDAYFEGVRRVKEDTKGTFQLVLCKKKDFIGK